MASICNGIVLHRGLRPYCGTFLIFSDYLRPAMRLSALSAAACTSGSGSEDLPPAAVASQVTPTERVEIDHLGPTLVGQTVEIALLGARAGVFPLFTWERGKGGQVKDCDRDPAGRPARSALPPHETAPKRWLCGQLGHSSQPNGAACRARGPAPGLPQTSRRPRRSAGTPRATAESVPSRRTSCSRAGSRSRTRCSRRPRCTTPWPRGTPCIGRRHRPVAVGEELHPQGLAQHDGG